MSVHHSGLILLLALLACASKSGDKKIVLFNGRDFSGWTRVLADSTVSVDGVWSVRDGVVHCKGVPNGYMRTNEAYSNYKLHLEWRWPENPTNSGVLLHCQPPDQVWPNCIECQLMAGNAGDFIIIGPGTITVDDSTYVNSERFLAIRKKHDSNEKPAGEWNTYDIEVRDSTIVCYVNGLMQNNGRKASPASGFIALQSEGSPIEFRNIYLTITK